ncbi:MAG: hypothetical protein HS101_17090 [Planctomycetia bacterium]|jgi:hypothetical protein|nr:hypothetical protein [Planctomycetia bacterium]MCC7315238.1 hypothetical protein [Planctomycetota bacterium]OQZ07176.1 MAG: hypothetical protein B6D36_01220 [Planctomycetes bacterium UTPLA1]
MKTRIQKLLLSLMLIALPVFSTGCDDDFYEDGHLTDAIYALGDAVSQVIVVSAAAFGPGGISH